jgi:DNA repair photolyase
VESFVNRNKIPFKGRGATENPEGRFEAWKRDPFDDGWPEADQDGSLTTTVHEVRSRSILTRNDSPDIPFSLSINPYAGCEHGCIYCYARPSHGYRGLSAGLDFETQLFAKVNAAELLRAELARPGYRCEVIALGANTDPYQPIEKRLRITRGIVEVLAEFRHPVAIITKSAMVERDLDLLATMARKRLAQVFLSITTLDHELARRMEPRASAPRRRLAALQALSAAGVPCGVMVAPVIPFLTDSELEAVLEAAREAGATLAGYVLLRLPFEVKDLFKAWLAEHFPLKADHVMSRVRAMRDGHENDPNFGSRMRGSGVLAELLTKRFRLACERLEFNTERSVLNTNLFSPPRIGRQMALF